MKSFNVYERRVNGLIETTLVARDGDIVADAETKTLEEGARALIGYEVEECDEAGVIFNVRLYPANDTNYETVLDKIEDDHPVSEWQNHNW